MDKREKKYKKVVGGSRKATTLNRQSSIAHTHTTSVRTLYSNG